MEQGSFSFFFFCHVYNPILGLLKNGFQMVLGAELCQTHKKHIGRNLRILEFQDLGLGIQLCTETENGLPSSHPLSAIPESWGLTLFDNFVPAVPAFPKALPYLLHLSNRSELFLTLQNPAVRWRLPAAFWNTLLCSLSS